MMDVSVVAVSSSRISPSLVIELHSIDLSIALAHPATSTSPLDIVVRHHDVASSNNNANESSGAFRIDVTPSMFMLALVRLCLSR